MRTEGSTRVPPFHFSGVGYDAAMFDPAADPALCDPDRLIELARAGDPEALERMTRCYGSRLIAVGRAHCRDAERARDAVQDALLAATEHLDDFRGDGSLEGWLVRMVARACYRMRRGRKKVRGKLAAAVDAI